MAMLEEVRSLFTRRRAASTANPEPRSNRLDGSGTGGDTTVLYVPEDISVNPPVTWSLVKVHVAAGSVSAKSNV